MLDREPKLDGLVKLHTARELTRETRFVSRAMAHGHWESPEDYRQGLLPLIVPLALLKHHLNWHPVPDWVHQQVYLHPYPKDLMLRNHV